MQLNEMQLVSGDAANVTSDSCDASDFLSGSSKR